MYCHTLQDKTAHCDLVEWRTDLQKGLPKLSKPWILSLRGRIDPRPYLKLRPQYVQVELTDLEYYRDQIGGFPLILATHLEKLDSLEPIDELMLHPADLYKIAAHIPDPILLMRFMRRIRSEPKLIGIALGEEGEVTRALSHKLGNPLTFVGSAAPGQMEPELLEKRFRCSSQTDETRVIALLGDPLHLSPGIEFHNALFAEKNIDMRYVNIPLKKGLAQFLDEVPDYFMGFSITTPLKKEAAEFGTEKAINTLKRTSNGWRGINTDGRGGKICLEKRCNLSEKKVAILGMSATGEAIGALLPNVTFFNRTAKKGAEPLSNFDPDLFDIIIQATSSGMSDESMPTKAIPRKKLVMELILRVTPFQKACESSGCEIITGREFFEQQAILQQEFWL